MAFDAGSVVGHFTLDSSGWTSGAEKVNKTSSGMTGSIFKAQLAYDLFKKALSAVVGFLKESVAEFVKHELAVKQTESVLKSTASAAGMTRNAVIGLSESLMNATGIEHDTILEAENLLLTFTKIGKDIFPQATETILDMSVALKESAGSAAIQLGKALQDPILGVTALRRVGVAFNDTQIKTIKALVDSGQAAKAQALILKELQTEFGGSAKAARDTFGGALKALDNQMGDVKETFGMYVAAIGRPFVETTINMVKGINDFLTSAEGMKKIQSVVSPVAGVLAVAFEMGKKFFDIISKFVSETVGNLVKGFSDIVGKGNESNIIFTILGGIVKVVAIAMTVLGKVIGVNIQYIVDMIAIIKNSVVTLKDFGIAMADPFNKSKWEKVGAGVTGTWESIKTLGVNLFTGIKDTIKLTYDEFSKLGTDAPKIGKQLETAYTNASTAMDTALENMRTNADKTGAALTGAGNAGETAANQIGKSWSDLSNKNKNVSREIQYSWMDTFGILSTTMETTVAKFGLFSKQGAKAINELVDHVSGAVGNILSTASSGFAQIYSIYDMSLQNEQTATDNDYKKKKAYIEANVIDETERAAQLAALEKEYNAKSADIKRRQFEAQKQGSIIQAIISTAQAVMTSFATFGWPLGLIPAAIMGVIGAAQIAAISSQPTPDFAAATGGTFSAGSNVLVGEKGPELITLGSTARITPNNQLGSTIDASLKIYGDIKKEIDFDNASLMQARRLKNALRAG